MILHSLKKTPSIYYRTNLRYFFSSKSALNIYFSLATRNASASSLIGDHIGRQSPIHIKGSSHRKSLQILRWSSSSHSFPNDDRIVLYQKKSQYLPRVALTFTSLHTAYWIWYIIDFIPFLQESGRFEVDPSVGYIGFGASIVMLCGSVLYPRYLIGEVSYLPQIGAFEVKRYTFPFCTLQKQGQIVSTMYSLEKVKEEFKGHVVVKVGEEKMLLKITEELKRDDSLWKVLQGEKLKTKKVDEETLLSGPSLKRIPNQGKKKHR